MFWCWYFDVIDFVVVVVVVIVLRLGVFSALVLIPILVLRLDSKSWSCNRDFGSVHDMLKLQLHVVMLLSTQIS